ncbi:MAG TPA: 50S ribosomal protein L20 [Candidatus Peregrinibacteria bacterium]|nr:50S ribosomal protein L20 [Candidatus Peregrinibacteria bacterium]
MTRVKGGVTSRRRHKKILKLAKGYGSLRSSVYRLAKQAVMKAGMNAYRDRRRKKRDFRRLWNIRINAAVRMRGLNYSTFVDKLFKNKVVINRKILADLAMNEPGVFDKVVDSVK